MFAARSWAITSPPPLRPTPGSGFSPTSGPLRIRGAVTPHCRRDGARAVPAWTPRSVSSVGNQSRAGWCSGHGRVGGSEDTLGAVPRGSASRGRPHRAAGLGLAGVSVPGGGRSAAGCTATAAIFRRTVPPMENTWNSPRCRGRAGKRRSSVRKPPRTSPVRRLLKLRGCSGPGRKAADGVRSQVGPPRAVRPPLSFITAAAPGRFQLDGTRGGSSSGMTAPPFGPGNRGITICGAGRRGVPSSAPIPAAMLGEVRPRLSLGSPRVEAPWNASHGNRGATRRLHPELRRSESSAEHREGRVEDRRERLRDRAERCSPPALDPCALGAGFDVKSVDAIISFQGDFWASERQEVAPR